MLGGLIPRADQLSKKAIMSAIEIPEGIVMLTIAVLLDSASLFLFILNFAYGIGIPLTWMISIVGGITIGFWAFSRSMFRGVIEQAVSNISEKVLNVGGGLEGSKDFQGTPDALEKTAKGGGKAVKTLAKGSLTAIRFILSLIAKLIPIVNNFVPAWTIMVVFTLVEGDI